MYRHEQEMTAAVVLLSNT